MKITINAKEVNTDLKYVGFTWLIIKAFNYGKDIKPYYKAYTITYSKGKNNSQGILSYGETVPIVTGMNFNVTLTNNA